MRTPKEQSDFMASRQNMIGGSDIGSLLSNQIPVEYGCERRLFYRLSDYPPDGPDTSTEPMMLGNILEDAVRKGFENATGARVDVVGLTKHPTIDFLQYHDDGIIHPHVDSGRKTHGVLEVKAVGREMMAKINADGLPLDYVGQLAGGQASHRLEYGAFAVGMREDLLPLVAIELASRLAGHPIPELPRQPKIVHFEMPRLDDIINLIESYAPKFWSTLKDESKIPPRLEPESARCQRCSYRVRCHGEAIMASVQPEVHIPRRRDLDPLIEEYRDRRNLLEESEALVTETEEKFKALLGKQTAIQVPILIDGKEKWKNILWRLSKGRETVDGRRMAAQYDMLRRSAIESGVPGAELVPPSSRFINVGMPSRPLRLSGILPPKPKKKGEVPEMDEESFEE